MTTPVGCVHEIYEGFWTFFADTIAAPELGNGLAGTETADAIQPPHALSLGTHSKIERCSALFVSKEYGVLRRAYLLMPALAGIALMAPGTQASYKDPQNSSTSTIQLAQAGGAGGDAGQGGGGEGKAKAGGGAGAAAGGGGGSAMRRGGPGRDGMKGSGQGGGPRVMQKDQGGDGDRRQRMSERKGDGDGAGQRVRDGRRADTKIIIRERDRRRGDRRRGTRYSWGGLGGVFYFYDGYYHGDCSWLRRKAVSTGSRYWWQRFRQCRNYN